MICIYNEIDSTNALAKVLILEHQRLKTFSTIVGLTQNKGHGKLGSSWSTPKGNLAFSIILQPINDSWFKYNNVGILSLFCVIIAHETISYFIKDNNLLKCKWANDLILNNAKLGGILIEAQQNHKKETALVCGIGINLQKSVSVNKYATISLKEYYQLKVDPIDFAYELHARFIKNFHKIFNNREQIIITFKKHAYKIGETITLTTMQNKVKTGIFQDIDENGYLLLRDKTANIEKISAGEVFIKNDSN